MLASRLFLERRIASKVSYIRKRMHELGGTGMESSCGVWWIDGTALGNGDGFFPSSKGR